MGRFVPGGSYTLTSRNIKVTLRAQTQKIDQSYIFAELDITDLDNADIANVNGVLVNQSGSAPSRGYVPGGSYQQTSYGITVKLSAECQKIDYHSWVPATLDITNLIVANIANIDGTLVNQAKPFIVAQYFGIFDDWYDRAMAQNPPFEKLNRLYIAFAWIEDGKLTYKNKGYDYQKITDLVTACRNKNPNVEILISSGYDNGTMYKYAAQDTQKLAKSVVDFINTHNLDGYDMDWENGIDQKCMNDLLDALRKAFDAEKKQYKLTLAVWPQPEGLYDLGKIAKYVDQINIMSYGPNSHLSDTVPAYYNSGNGIPYEKIIGGIETEIDYREAGVHDTLGDTGSIKQKCDYALDKRLGGMMGWRLDNDFASGVVPAFSGAEYLYTNLYKYMKANVGK